MKDKHWISRRKFLGTGLAAAAGPAMTQALARGSAALPGSPAKKGLKFSAMVTLGDWAIGHGVWEEPGVYYVLRRMKEAGFSRAYWRTTDGCGQANYPSRVTNAAQQFIRDPKGFPEQKFILDFLKITRPTATEWLQSPIDFSKFDSVKAARDWSRQLGLEFYCWHEHAEDHGGVGQPSRLSIEHPEWLTKNRDGKRSHCRFSWGIRPAMDYRLSWVMEVMQYHPDGIFFDFTKSMEGTPRVGATPHFDDNGVWYCSYDDPILSAFKEKTGKDPHKIPNGDEDWVRFRAGYAADFMRRVRQMQRELYPEVKIGLFGCPRGRDGLAVSDKVIPLADPLHSYLEDQETWTREGLIDEFVNAYTSGANQRKPESIRATIADSRARVQAPCRYRGSQIEVYWAKDEKSIADMVQAVAEAGCDEVVFFETTPLESNKTWDATKKLIEKFGA